METNRGVTMKDNTLLFKYVKKDALIHLMLGKQSVIPVKWRGKEGFIVRVIETTPLYYTCKVFRVENVEIQVARKDTRDLTCKERDSIMVEVL